MVFNQLSYPDTPEIMVFKDTGYQAMKASDPWDTGNIEGELCDFLNLMFLETFQAMV